jgi:hypothetical protein
VAIRIGPANREHPRHSTAVMPTSPYAFASFLVVKQTAFRCLEQLKRSAWATVVFWLQGNTAELRLLLSSNFVKPCLAWPSPRQSAAAVSFSLLDAEMRSF